MSQAGYDAGRLEADKADEVRDQDADELEARRAEVEQTRAEITDTMDAIKEKLSPQHIAEQAKETIREATIGRAQDVVGRAVDRTRGKMGGAMSTARDAGGNFMDVIRENPIPAAMLGLGLGLLIMSARKGQRREHSSDVSQRDYRTGGEYLGSAGYMEEQEYGRRQPGEGIGARVSGAAETVKARTGEMTQTVREKASRLGETAQRRSRRTADNAQRWWYENPLTAGVLALGAGLALGMLVPESEAEKRWMGEKRNQFLETAQEKARQIGEKVQHVAQEVMTAAKETARQEARKEGLVGEQGTEGTPGQRAA